MEITRVDVYKINKEGQRVKGIANVVLDDCFAVNDIVIREGENGMGIFMPSKKLQSGKHKDLAHPINKETRKMFEDAIFEEYNKTE